MRRFLFLALLGMISFLYVGCSSSPTTSTTKSSGGGSSNPAYSFANQIGAYDWNGVNCDWWTCGPAMPVSATYDNPTGVAVGGGFIFVADQNTGYISKFDLNGNFITSFWGYYEPEGMATDGHGHLYVGNAYYSEVDIFDYDGNWLGYLDPAGSTFYWPYNVAYGPDGNVYVTDTWFYGLYKVSPTNVDGGTLLASTYGGDPALSGGSFEDPLGVAVDASNNVYVADYDNNAVQVFNSSLVWSKIIGTPATSTPTTVTGQLYYPWGLALDNGGNILVGDTQDDSSYARIQKFSNGGSFLQEFGNTPLPATTDPNWTQGQLYEPAYIAVDPSNNVYVTDVDWKMIFEYSN